MARINDVGGVEGFGPVDPRDDGQPFHADWEARMFGVTSALLADEHFTLDAFRDAIERMAPADYLGASYYRRWFAAVTTLLAEAGILDESDLVSIRTAGEDPA